MVLLAGAALCVRSLMNANAIDAGFDTHHIVLATLDLGTLGYTQEKINDFYAPLLERVEHLPGVTSASYAQFLPLGTARSDTSVSKQLGKDTSYLSFLLRQMSSLPRQFNVRKARVDARRALRSTRAVGCRYSWRLGKIPILNVTTKLRPDVRLIWSSCEGVVVAKYGDVPTGVGLL